MKSGARNTADHAGTQGRELFAVPGDADLPRSEGTNDLIATKNAFIARNGADILRVCFGEADDDRPPADSPPLSLAPLERELVAMIEEGPKSVDALLSKVGTTVSKLLAALSGLERAGIAQRDDRGHYARFGKTTVSG